jgi:hypothetical protein
VLDLAPNCLTEQRAAEIDDAWCVWAESFVEQMTGELGDAGERGT